MCLNFCFEWSGRLRVEAVGTLRFLHGCCSREGLDQKLCLNIMISIRASGSFGLFVGQCVASLETSQSDVTRSSLFLLSVQYLKCGSGKCNKVSASCCSCLCKEISRKTCSSQ